MVRMPPRKQRKKTVVVELRDRRHSFASLRTLLDIIKNEPFFRIQVFSLEAVEFFEKWLRYERLEYAKQFTSAYAPVKGLVLLIRDTSPGYIPPNSTVLLYSNARDARFIPYKFEVTLEEKEAFTDDKYLLESYKRGTLTSMLGKRIDIGEYTAKSLGYVQSIILFCMIREKKFNRLADEVKAVDAMLSNRFVVQCELNGLVKMGFCKRNGNSYTINICKEILEKVCRQVGFGDAFKH